MKNDVIKILFELFQELRKPSDDYRKALLIWIEQGCQTRNGEKIVTLDGTVMELRDPPVFTLEDFMFFIANKYTDSLLTNKQTHDERQTQIPHAEEPDTGSQKG